MTIQTQTKPTATAPEVEQQIIRGLAAVLKVLCGPNTIASLTAETSEMAVYDALNEVRELQYTSAMMLHDALKETL